MVRTFWRGGLVLWIRWVFLFGTFLLGAKNVFCVSISMLAVPLCKRFSCGMLLLTFDVCLGIVWDGCPPPRRFDPCVKAIGVRVTGWVGMLLGWDFVFLNVDCAFVECCICILLFWDVRCCSSKLVCCCEGMCGIVVL